MEDPSARQPPSSHVSYDASNNDESVEDETQSSVDIEASANRDTEETDVNKPKKRSKKSSSKNTEQAAGNYNRYFLSNFKIENIFSFNKKHDFRLSQDKVGLILSDPSAFEKLQAHLRQEGCVTDGTIRVNYNDLLRTRLLEIEESHEESKEDELSYSGTTHGLLDTVVPRSVERERRLIPESTSNAISGSTPLSGILDSECVTPAKEIRPQELEESNSLDDRNSNSSFQTNQDQATKSSASSSPTSVLEMMDFAMKDIDQVAETSDNYEEDELYDKANGMDDEFVEDDSSVDSGLFVENRTFSRPAASAPVAARPWGPDSAPTKEEKIWDICAVEAPATTMDFDHLWEDEEDSDVDLSPYRRDPYDYSSDEDNNIYNDADYSSQSKDEKHPEPTSSSNGESWRSNSVRADDIEFTFDPNQVIASETERKGQRVRFSIKKEFAYPSPGHETSESSQQLHDDDDLGAIFAKSSSRKAASLSRKRISRRQKRHHVIETLEI